MVGADELKRQVLFEDIAEAERGKLATSMKEIKLKKGDVLFKEGDDTSGIYMIRSGKVEISKVTPDGWRQTLAVLSTGSFFGELSLMEKRRHEANAAAIENSELILLSKEDFDRLEKENPVLVLQMMKKLAAVTSKNLRRMNDKFLQALISY